MYIYYDCFETNSSPNIEKTIIYALDFDLTSPNFNDVQYVSVDQIRSISNDLKLSTSKKLGFKMASDKAKHPQ